jgi:hypothetical protein
VRLFGKSEERIAREAAAQAEIERLRALTTEELAVLLLPALGPDVTPRGHHRRSQQLCEYLLRDFPGAGQTRTLQLMSPVRRALEKLQDAGLVSAFHLERSPLWQITSLGTNVLAEGTTERHLVVPS